MKHIQATIYLLLTSCFIMTSAQAHDPSEHINKNEPPKCESMKAMDHSKTDANDPNMMAMIKKCKAQAHNEAIKIDHGNMETDHGNMKMDHGNMGMDHSTKKDVAKKTTDGHHNHN